MKEKKRKEKKRKEKKREEKKRKETKRNEKKRKETKICLKCFMNVDIKRKSPHHEYQKIIVYISKKTVLSHLWSEI